MKRWQVWCEDEKTGQEILIADFDTKQEAVFTAEWCFDRPDEIEGVITVLDTRTGRKF